MEKALFAMPIKPNMLDEYKKFTDECTGPKRSEYIDLLKRYGLQTVDVWHQQFGDKVYVMVLHNITENAMELLATWTSSTHPFDQWFNQQCLKCYDIESFDDLPAQPEFLFGVDTNAG